VLRVGWYCRVEQEGVELAVSDNGCVDGQHASEHVIGRVGDWLGFCVLSVVPPYPSAAFRIWRQNRGCGFGLFARHVQTAVAFAVESPSAKVDCRRV
jgi:hypothetical protein